ncbi:CCR4-NOT transcription complex subunit 4 [Gossypium australe]|uniref:CCR4-NOT transcription complex subunit 4 n=1 Tax=Gossypium australe TaxID=47621 RepID=A0A5B6VRE7_9ROSI|nr:CCR4-NOT transcription complex subunit 4 [Gossypium australe]
MCAIALIMFCFFSICTLWQICVWCWHHIMDMAEKDNTEGRCPACRSVYDKDKIVGMAANCERLSSSPLFILIKDVALVNCHCLTCKVFPLKQLLQQLEYFGQYGKVLKVSMSRTAAGVIQQFPNNTCSVYITYSKEEEAIRCIQSVHGFVLEGRPLKYENRHALPCNNPDCLYLHEIGPQEDSFTKDEIISAYTRVQQITGATNNMQRRAGNTLPPPVDDYCPNSSASAAKSVSKSAPNNTTVSISRCSPPNGSSGRSIALPAGASWGMRALNQPQSTILACSNGPSKLKSDIDSNTIPFSSAGTNTNQSCTLHVDARKKSPEEIHSMIMKGKPDLLKPLQQTAGFAVEKPPSPDIVSASKSLSSQLSCPPASSYNDQVASVPSTATNSVFDHEQSLISPVGEVGSTSTADGKIQSLCSDMSTLTLDKTLLNGHSDLVRPSSSASGYRSSNSPSSQGLQQCCTELYSEHLSSPVGGRSMTSHNGGCVSQEQSDWRTQTQVVENTSSEVEEDVLSFDNQRIKDPEVISHSSYLPNSTVSLHLSNHSRAHSLQHSETFGAVNMNADTPLVDNKVRDNLHPHGSRISSFSNEYPEKYISSGISSDITSGGFLPLLNEEQGKQMGKLLGNAECNTGKDTGENSIISNILSLDFDTWDESLTSPQNLAKLLGDTDKEFNSLKLSSSWKALNNNQSRFLFARQEDSKYNSFDADSSFGVFGQMLRNHPSSRDFAESRDLYPNKFGISNGFSSSNFKDSDKFTSSSSVFSSSKLSAVSRTQISAPPGFSVPSKAPPPGFSYHERVDPVFDTVSENHLMDSSSLLRNSYQARTSVGIGGPGDIEFIDPAILAVGKGRHQGGLSNAGLDLRPNFQPQLSPLDDEARLQLLMQRSLSRHQNLRYDIGENFSSLNDSYGITSRLMDQSQVNNMSPFAQLSLQQSRNSHMSNGHWDGYNDVQGGSNLGVAELLRNERLGFNKFYSGYEDSKYRMTSSGDLYNRTYGM